MSNIGTIQKNFCTMNQIVGFDKLDCEYMNEAYSMIMSKKENEIAVINQIERYTKGETFDFEDLILDAENAAVNSNVHKYTSYLIYLMIIASFSFSYFEEKGVCKGDWEETMRDFRWKSSVCKKVYGIFGISGPKWYENILNANVIAFNRLQFELIEADMPYKSECFSVECGDPLVKVHIPSNTDIPFTRENRKKSYENAANFFARYFEDENVIFRCGTWLLHPDHRKILPESSNIRDFLDDFELDLNSFIERDDDIWRLFYIKNYNGDPTTLPEDTSLMRIYKKYLLSGGKAGWCIGYRMEKCNA